MVDALITLSYVIAGLKIAHSVPVLDPLAGQIVDAEHVRLGLHQPFGHAYRLESSVDPLPS